MADEIALLELRISLETEAAGLAAQRRRPSRGHRGPSGQARSPTLRQPSGARSQPSQVQPQHRFSGSPGRQELQQVRRIQQAQLPAGQ